MGNGYWKILVRSPACHVHVIVFNTGMAKSIWKEELGKTILPGYAFSSLLLLFLWLNSLLWFIGCSREILSWVPIYTGLKVYPIIQQETSAFGLSERPCRKIPHNHEMVWVGRGLKRPLIPAPALGEQVLPLLISAAKS